MTNIANYAEDALLGHLLTNTPLASPTTVYAAIHSGDPSETGELNEVGVDRQAISFGVVSAGSVSNDAEVSWANMPTVTVTHVSIKDAATGGNTLFWGALTESEAVSSGETFRLRVGDLTVTLD